MSTQLRYPHDKPPAPGSIITIAPGVHWLRMPLPFALDHINLWLLRDGDGWCLVDTGINRDETKRLWEEIFSIFLGGRPVTRLICTHFHPDHMGLAGWLSERWKLTPWATQAEWMMGRLLCQEDDEAFVAAQTDYLRMAGCDEAVIALAGERGNSYAKRVSPVPARYHRLSAGDVLRINNRDWHVLIGEGHAPEHACLHCPELNLLIAGDQVLPKISPNIGVWAHEPKADSLGRFLSSLDQFLDLPRGTLVLPSHGLPFIGLHERISHLKAHHRLRLEEAEEACAGGEGRSTVEILPVLFKRELDAHQLFFALAETLAHLRHLVTLGRLEEAQSEAGATIFRKPQSAAASASAGAQ